MANNNEEQDYTNSLKERFCRQYFPSLKLFLEDFNISEYVDDNNVKYSYNSLGMHFLLEAYNEKDTKQREELKKSCYWSLNNVKEDDVFFAIEEFFYITGNKRNINRIDDQRNTLLETLFEMGLNSDEQITISDSILYKIAEYFGIRGNINKLGNMYQSIDSIAKYTTDINILRFANALKLFSSVRNRIHEGKNYKGERLNLYHQFIIFTYIGYIYVCRRIWREIELKKTTTKKMGCIDISLSKEAENFIVAPDTIEITIEKGDHKLEDICCYQFKKAIRPFNNLSYTYKIQKYEPFQIVIKSDKGTFQIEDMSDYYSWKKHYTIILPEKYTSSFKENVKFSEGMNKMIENILEKMRNCNKELKEVISQELSSIEPIMQQIRNGFIISEESKESIVNILEHLNSLDDCTNQTKEKIGQIHGEIKKLHETFIGKLDEFSDSLYDLKEKNKIIVEKVDTLIELVKQNRKYLWIITFVIGLVFIRYILFNLDYLQYPILSSFFILSIIILIISSYCFYRQSNPLRFIKGKFTRVFALGAIALISWFGLNCAIDIGRTFFVNHCYDFAEKDPEMNQKIANLMESILGSNPDAEETRIKLTRYYLDYANDTEKALAIASPMLDDIEKHPRGILAIIEALYSKGKDFWKVRDLLDSYKKTNDCDSNVVNRIEGIMNVWGQGQTSDIAKGYNLLRLSADNGDPEAQYYLGYALSHEMTDWEKPRKDSAAFTGFNLVEAIEYLRKAFSVKPKAALELGQLYADLNMKDSAVFYFNHALSHSKGELYKASLYRLGLLFKDIDSIKSNTYMMKAALLDYEPAILYKAFHSKDHKASIELYNTPQAYKGYKTIIPVVFEYLALGQKNNALKALYEARPYGKFNQNFILGMETMLGSPQRDRDSIAGMSYMESSAKQGCIYAKMICLYRNMEQYAKKGIIIQSKVDSLSEIGQTIPFANILVSDLMQNSGRYYESINQIEYARKEYQIAEDAALKALYYGHPASIKMLGDMRLAGFKFQYGIPLNNLTDYKKELSKHSFMLRFNEKKYYSIASGYVLERIIFNRWGSNREFEMPNKDFWINIAIANHHFEGECALLNEVSNEEENYLKRLVNAALNDITFSCDSGAISLLNYRINILSTKTRYEKWISELKNKYKEDPLRNNVFEECDITKLEDTPVSINFSWLNKKVEINDRNLLNELSDNNDVDGRIYEKPF